MTGYARDQDLRTTTLGLRAEARVSPEVPLIVRGLLGWRRAYGDVDPEALLASAAGASAFRVEGAPVDRDALVAEAGLAWQASDAVSLGLIYAGQIGRWAQDHVSPGASDRARGDTRAGHARLAALGCRPRKCFSLRRP